MFDPHKKALREIHEHNAEVIVCLSSRDECVKRTGVDLLEKYGMNGYAVINYFIEDLHTPSDLKSFSELVDRVHNLLKKGCNVYVHCHAGIGRTGLLICCLAKRYTPANIQKDQVIPWIRSIVRGAVQVHSDFLSCSISFTHTYTHTFLKQTKEQEDFVRKF
jgi:hypothetical protein